MRPCLGLYAFLDYGAELGVLVSPAACLIASMLAVAARDPSADRSAAGSARAASDFSFEPPPESEGRKREFEARRERYGFSLFVDQDLFYPPRNEDRNYTMGVGVQLRGAWLRESRPTSWLGSALDSIDGIGPFARIHQDHVLNTTSNGREGSFLTFGVTAFTPDEIEKYEAIDYDRPYASLAFLSFSRATNARDRKWWAPVGRVFRTELTFGVLGLRIAETVQTAIHRTVRSPGAAKPYDPHGWTHQVSDGGEPTALYRAGLLGILNESNYFDLGWVTEGSVGYYTNAAVGGVARLGRMRTNIAYFDPRPMNAYDQVESPGRGSPRAVEFFFWGGARYRLVAYNALLQGQFRKSDVRLSAGQIDRLVPEYEVGATVGWCGFSATYVALAGRGPEHNLITKREHQWGGAYVSYQSPARGIGCP
jgi:hypothetical protein